MQRRFPPVWDEGVHVDEGFDVRVVGPVGDHGTAVAVSDQDDRPAGGMQEAGEMGGVGLDASQRVAGTWTVKPSRCSSPTTLAQLDPSAQAPWTSTTVDRATSFTCAPSPQRFRGVGSKRTVDGSVGVALSLNESQADRVPRDVWSDRLVSAKALKVELRVLGRAGSVVPGGPSASRECYGG